MEKMTRARLTGERTQRRRGRRGRGGSTGEGARGRGGGADGGKEATRAREAWGVLATRNETRGHMIFFSLVGRPCIRIFDIN